MRIISGTYKGKQITPDKNFSARPTTDFAKESLFNILANRFDFESLEVLDLFSGTGSISYEFASRGAVRIDVVEMNPKHASFIAKTAENLKMKQIKVLRLNAFQFLKLVKYQYDIVFADPPYDMKGVETLPSLVFSSNAIKEGGILILEHSKHISFLNHPNLLEHRNYGSVNFSFFQDTGK